MTAYDPTQIAPAASAPMGSVAETYDEWLRRVRAQRVAFVVPLVAGSSLALALVTALRGPGAAKLVALGGGAAIAVVAITLAVRARGVERPGSSIAAVGCALAASAVVAASFATEFGGVGGIASSLLVVSWAFGAVITPRPPAWLAAVLATHAAIYVAVASMLAGTPPRAPWVLLAVLGAGIAVVTGGSVRRARDDRGDFDATRKLGTAVSLLESRRAELQRANDDLERTVQAQVSEVLSHAKTTQDLEQKLAARVAARSRGLASVVDRASSPHLIVPLARDTIVGGRARIIDRVSPAPYDPSYLAVDTGDRDRRVLVSMHDADDAEIASKAIAALRRNPIPHPALPALVHAAVVDDHFVCRIVEHRPGTALFRAMTRPDLTVWEAVRLAHGIASILTSSHKHSLFHLALDPYRILIHQSGAPLTLHGIGLVQAFAAARKAPPSHKDAIRSTPAYRAPEQCLGDPRDSAAADTYALGLLLFEMVAKIHPVVAGLSEDGRGVADALRRVEARVPPELASLVERMLAMAPEHRPSMEDVEEELAAIAERFGAPALYLVALRICGSIGGGIKAVRESL